MLLLAREKRQSLTFIIPNLENGDIVLCLNLQIGSCHNHKTLLDFVYCVIYIIELNASFMLASFKFTDGDIQNIAVIATTAMPSYDARRRPCKDWLFEYEIQILSAFIARSIYCSPTGIRRFPTHEPLKQNQIYSSGNITAVRLMVLMVYTSDSRF